MEGVENEEGVLRSDRVQQIVADVEDIVAEKSEQQIRSTTDEEQNVWSGRRL